MLIILFFADDLLIAIKQDPEVSKVARDYVVWCMPGAMSLVYFDSTKRFL